MSDKKSVRLNKLAKEFNVGMDRILAFLNEKGVEGIKPSSKISHDLYMDLLGKFQPDLKAKLAADLASKEREDKREQQRIKEEQTLALEEEKKKASKIAKEKRKEEEKQIAEALLLSNQDMEEETVVENESIAKNTAESSDSESLISQNGQDIDTVSYTHLTLPTILRV